MRVLVAGDGPVARALGGALERSGVLVDRWTRARAPEVVAHDAAIVAVSDRAIGEVAARLIAERQASDWTVLLHCSGVLPPEEAFRGVRSSVRGVGLLHPLRAFPRGEPGDREREVDLRGTVFGVAGDEAGRPLASELARRLGGRPLGLDASSLGRYHAAAVLVGNHTLALVDAAIELLVGEGLERQVAAQALAGLLGSAASNVAASGLPEALTGPIARGDADAVARHLAALGSAAPGIADLYRTSARATLALARRRAAADPAALDAVARLLG